MLGATKIFAMKSGHGFDDFLLSTERLHPYSYFGRKEAFYCLTQCWEVMVRFGLSFGKSLWKLWIFLCCIGKWFSSRLDLKSIFSLVWSEIHFFDYCCSLCWQSFLKFGTLHKANSKLVGTLRIYFSIVSKGFILKGFILTGFILKGFLWSAS